MFPTPPTITALVTLGRLCIVTVEPHTAASQATSRATREDTLAALRLRARVHIAADTVLFSALELSDIEARYRSAHLEQSPLVRFAVHLVSRGRLDDAEQVATDLATMFPEAIDLSGAPLDDVLKSIRLLRPDDR